MKCNQSLPGFELVSPCPFPTTITITPRAPLCVRYIDEFFLISFQSNTLKNYCIMRFEMVFFDTRSSLHFSKYISVYMMASNDWYRLRHFTLWRILQAISTSRYPKSLRKKKKGKIKIDFRLINSQFLSSIFQSWLPSQPLFKKVISIFHFCLLISAFRADKEKKQKVPRKNNYRRRLRRWHSGTGKYTRPSRNTTV